MQIGFFDGGHKKKHMVHGKRIITVCNICSQYTDFYYCLLNFRAKSSDSGNFIAKAPAGTCTLRCRLAIQAGLWYNSSEQSGYPRDPKRRLPL